MTGNNEHRNECRATKPGDIVLLRATAIGLLRGATFDDAMTAFCKTARNLFVSCRLIIMEARPRTYLHCLTCTTVRCILCQLPPHAHVSGSQLTPTHHTNSVQCVQSSLASRQWSALQVGRLHPLGRLSPHRNCTRCAWRHGCAHACTPLCGPPVRHTTTGAGAHLCARAARGGYGAPCQV